MSLKKWRWHFPSDCWKPRGEAFIFRVPDELLVSILELASVSPDFWTWCCDCHAMGKYATMKQLARVCHRFNQCILPLLYRSIRFDYPHGIVPPTTAVRRLYRSLQNNASLRQYCQTLSIHINDVRDTWVVEDFFIANDFVSWLTKVRCLQIHGGFDKPHNEHTWLLIRNVVQHMREVEHLNISRQSWGLLLGPIMEHVDLPLLRKLNIHGISEKKDGAVVLEPKVLASITSPLTLRWKAKRKNTFDTLFIIQAITYED